MISKIFTVSLLIFMNVIFSENNFILDGYVRDIFEKPIINTKLVITHNNTNLKTEIATDSNGFFKINDIKRGSYTLTIKDSSNFII